MTDLPSLARVVFHHSAGTKTFAPATDLVESLASLEAAAAQTARATALQASLARDRAGVASQENQVVVPALVVLQHLPHATMVTQQNLIPPLRQQPSSRARQSPQPNVSVKSSHGFGMAQCASVVVI